MKKVTLFMLLFFVNYCFSQKEKSTQLSQTTLEKLQMSVYKKDSSASAIVLMDQGNFFISVIQRSDIIPLIIIQE